MLKALILDDELTNISVLKYELELYCPDILTVADFTNPVEALKYLSNNQVDVVFLDITMPLMSGFEFLNCQKSIDYQVVFVTAHQEYAINAFDFYAIDYLVKPVSKEKLKRAVERLKDRVGQKNKENGSISLMLQNFNQSNGGNNHLAIPTLEGFELVDLSKLRYLTASGNYTLLKIGQNEMLVSKILGDFEKILDPGRFLRIHNSVIVQLKDIKKYIKGDGGQVEMTDGQILPVSRANKPKLMSYIKFE